MSEKDFSFDDYTPSDIAKKVESAGGNKAKLNFLSLFLLSVMAGAFIAIAGEFYTMVIFDSSLSLGLTKLIGGICFSIGLILVVVAGAELFTGNAMIIMAFASRIVTWKQLLRNWSVSYVGNFIGSLSVVFLMFLTNQWKTKEFMLGAKAVQIAATKTNLGFVEAFASAILCNALVCLAVWMCFSARTVISKIAAIIFPITAFVASGFEHSIANMFFIPMGMILKNNPGVLDALSKMSPDLDISRLSMAGLFGNLLPVTLGNIIGGSIMVGLIYWIIILLPQKRRDRRTGN
ncbi:MAG TPA: formate transporter FocA [Actinobacteria bacterium]|nr:formate transporter FocA [Actinomycetota bacterium]